MARVIKPRNKICRRLGVNLWGKVKDPLHQRPYPPGEHGPGPRRKLSDYARRLMEKQKLRYTYGLMERQFLRTFTRAARLHGVTGDNLMVLLECRLDAVVYRLGFAPTIWAARQWVTHGHVLVNGVRTNIPSYLCRPGDEISIREASRRHPVLLEAMHGTLASGLPSYLTRDDAGFSGRLVARPEAAHIPLPVQIDTSLIVEFYSR